MRGIAWKAILSEAVVTGGEALGEVVRIRLPERQYLVTSPLMARYCLTDSCRCVYTTGTASRVTNASLSTALQAGRSLRQQHILVLFFNDNRDNGNNGKNGRN